MQIVLQHLERNCDALFLRHICSQIFTIRHTMFHKLDTAQIFLILRSNIKLVIVLVGVLSPTKVDDHKISHFRGNIRNVVKQEVLAERVHQLYSAERFGL
uniref:(northern house mosquito) hypothetical protein n=1 Tax=Culex pipiens TaxID=7175 RepID=A0A8D8K3T4_CULPI